MSNDTSTKRRVFKKAVAHLEHIIRSEPDYSDKLIAKAHLESSRERLIELYEEALGYKARAPHSYHRYGQYIASGSPK